MADIDGFKIKITEKNHLNPLDDHLRSSLVINSYEYGQLPSLVLGEKGKKRFEGLFSSNQEFKPGRRTLCAPSKGDELKRGKRYIPPKQYNNDEAFFFKNSSCPKRSETTDLPVVGWTRKRSILIDNEGAEYSVGDSMGRKQSVQSMSNSASHSTLRRVEHQPQFYAEGGLIVGSTIKSKHSLVDSSSAPKLKPVFRSRVDNLEREEILALTVRLDFTVFTCVFSFILLF